MPPATTRGRDRGDIGVESCLSRLGRRRCGHRGNLSAERRFPPSSILPRWGWRPEWERRPDWERRPERGRGPERGRRVRTGSSQVRSWDPLRQAQDRLRRDQGERMGRRYSEVSLGGPRCLTTHSTPTRRAFSSSTCSTPGSERTTRNTSATRRRSSRRASASGMRRTSRAFPSSSRGRTIVRTARTPSSAIAISTARTSPGRTRRTTGWSRTGRTWRAFGALR